MAILYEEKPSDVGLKFVFLIVELFLLPFLFSMLSFAKMAPNQMLPIMIIPALIILLIMAIVAGAYLVVFGSSFIVTDEGIILTELLFKKRRFGFEEISKVESAKPNQEGFQQYFSFGGTKHHAGFRKYVVSSAKSESGETFSPDLQYSNPSQHQAPDGVVLFFKDSKKMYISASDNVKLISILKDKIK